MRESKFRGSDLRKMALHILIIIIIVAVAILIGLLMARKYLLPKVQATFGQMQAENVTDPQQLESAGIPADALAYEGHYYYIYTDAVSWSDARFKCMEKGGHLATLTTKKESNKVYRYMKKQDYASAFFGAKVFGSAWGGNWLWVTGENSDETNWAKEEPSVGDEYNSIYAAFYESDKGKWRALPCDYLTVYICEWDSLDGVSNDVLTLGYSEIHPDAWEYNGHHYYLYTNDCPSWELAEIRCRELGGHLAVINDGAENEFLYNYMLSMGLRSAFFGYTDKYEEGNWAWVAGQSTDYSRWSEGEPNGDISENYGMYYDTSVEYHWNDGSWIGYAPYLCEWEQ